jgi:hypothetical protein
MEFRNVKFVVTTLGSVLTTFSSCRISCLACLCSPSSPSVKYGTDWNSRSMRHIRVEELVVGRLYSRSLLEYPDPYEIFLMTYSFIIFEVVKRLCI